MHIPSPLFGAMDMYRELINALRRVLRVEERRLNPEELRQLAEAIIDYGRMIAQEELTALTPPYVIVEIPELARRFREPTQTIRDALLLLNEMGRAEPAYRGGYWKLKLAGLSARGREEPRPLNVV
jgi:hypothetical protein